MSKHLAHVVAEDFAEQELPCIACVSADLTPLFNYVAVDLLGTCRAKVMTLLDLKVLLVKVGTTGTCFKIYEMTVRGSELPVSDNVFTEHAVPSRTPLSNFARSSEQWMLILGHLINRRFWIQAEWQSC